MQRHERVRRVLTVVEFADGSLYAIEQADRDTTMELAVDFGVEDDYGGLWRIAPPYVEAVTVTTRSKSYTATYIADPVEWMRQRRSDRPALADQPALPAAPPIALPPGAPR